MKTVLLIDRRPGAPVWRRTTGRHPISISKPKGRITMRTRFSACAAMGAALAALAAVLLPARVAAQTASPPPHFVFRVPLDITQMTAALPAVEVHCLVHSAQNTGLGQGLVRVNIDAQTGRPMQAVAEVPVRLPATANPYDARTYRCRLSTHPSGFGQLQSVPVNPAEGGIDPSKPRVELVTGSIP